MNMNAVRINPLNTISNQVKDIDNRNITDVDELMEVFPQLNYRVETYDMAEITNDVNFAGYRAVRREDNNEVMSIVKERYTPIQNREIFEPLSEILKENEAKFIAGGIVQGGRKAWVQAELKTPLVIRTRAGNDIIKNYIIGMIHHDGLGSNAIMPFTTRIVCSNQFTAIKKASAGFSIRHSKTWEQRVNESRIRFNRAMKSNNEFAEVASKMASLDMSENEFENFSSKILPDVKPNKYAPNGRSLEGKRNIMLNLFRNGAGNHGATRWDAFNAVTEYFDHYEGSKRLHTAIARGRDVQTTMERRFMNNLASGQINSIKYRAYEMLSNLN